MAQSDLSKRSEEGKISLKWVGTRLDENTLLPLVIVLGNSYPDAGDDQCERPWHPCRMAATIVPRRPVSSRLPANLASCSNFWKKDGGGITSHLHRFHLSFMFLFTSGIPERGLEFPDEVIPMWVLESGAGGISVVVDPKVLSTMGPQSLAHLMKREVAQTTMSDETLRNWWRKVS